MKRAKLFAPPVQPRPIANSDQNSLLARRFMKLLGWVRFTWELKKLPPLTAELPEHYHIGPATDEMIIVFEYCSQERVTRQLNRAHVMAQPVSNVVILITDI
jgi:hypothetical protein